MRIPIIGAGGPSDRLYIPLATRKGNIIPNEKRLEHNRQRLMAASRILTQAHPDVKLRSLTATYNCVGMVFASRRTWVDTSYVSNILKEDGYTLLPCPNQTEVGDIVIYKDGSGNNITHVGIIIEKIADIKTNSFIINVMSQWGADGEYIHLVDNVPSLLGKPAEYWTDRR